VRTGDKDGTPHERIRLVSATHKAAEPEPEVEFDEREEELVRG
jgi:hypothetical protein